MKQVTPNTQCYLDIQWKEYLLGKLNDGALFERMSQHLEGCPACLSKVDSIHRSANAEAGHLTARNFSSETEFHELVAWLNEFQKTSPAEEPASSTLLPTQLGRFKVQKRLGRGSFGNVYLADDPLLNRQVAIKVPHSTHSFDKTQATKFLAEARNAAALEHPNIVQVYDVIMDNPNTTLIVMKYVSGRSLRDLMSSNKPSLQNGLELLCQLARTIHAAHEVGFVHRDLKPANVLVDDHGQAFVTDFGLGTFLSDEVGEPALGGTPCYMAPEQVRKETSDRRCDIWALGVILAELATGQRPFPQRNRSELFEAIEFDEPQLDAPKTLDPVAKIVRRCLEKDPNQRYQSALELANDLSRVVKRQFPQGLNRWRHGARRNILLVAIVAVLAMIILATLWYIDRSHVRSTLAQLRTSPDEQLPALIHSLQSRRPSADVIRNAVKWDDQSVWKRDLALLACDSNDSGEIKQILEIARTATPSKISAIAGSFAELGKSKLVSQQIKQTMDSRNVELAEVAILAKLSPTDVVWSDLRLSLTDQILANSKFQDASWIELLQPIAVEHIAPELQRRGLDKGDRQKIRLCNQLLVQLVRHQPSSLVSYAASADLDCLNEYLSGLKQNREIALTQLHKDWDLLVAKSPVATIVADRGEPTALQIDKARIAVLLAILNDYSAWDLAVQDDEDPTLRTLVTHTLSQLDYDESAIVKKLESHLSDSSRYAANIKFALLQLLSLSGNRIESDHLNQIVNQLWTEDVDAGIHSMARLLANRLGISLTQSNSKETSDSPSNWIRLPVGTTLQDFVVLPSGLASVGRRDTGLGQPLTDPWPIHERMFPRKVAIATTEVTIDQMRPWEAQKAYKLLERLPASSAMIHLNLNDAYRFCNWLSESAGLELCYEPSEEPTLLVPKEKCVELNGFRLPTDAEWELACRAGSVTSRSFGNVPSVVSRYAWTGDEVSFVNIENQAEMSLPVASLIPNRWGFFDMYGNALDMCDESVGPTENGNQTVDGLIAKDVAQMHKFPLVRGGCYLAPSEYALSHNRVNRLVGTAMKFYGFRLARTLVD